MQTGEAEVTLRFLAMLERKDGELKREDGQIARLRETILRMEEDEDKVSVSCLPLVV